MKSSMLTFNPCSIYVLSDYVSTMFMWLLYSYIYLHHVKHVYLSLSHVDIPCLITIMFISSLMITFVKSLINFVLLSFSWHLCLCHLHSYNCCIPILILSLDSVQTLGSPSIYNLVQTLGSPLRFSTSNQTIASSWASYKEIQLQVKP